MSGQPDICVDIFSAIANMMATFNNQIGISGGDTFSHEAGYTNSVDPTATTQNPTNPMNFEDQMNNYSYVFFVGAMILFLAYQHLGGLLQPSTTKSRSHMGNSFNNGSPGAGGVH